MQTCINYFVKSVILHYTFLPFVLIYIYLCISTFIYAFLHLFISICLCPYVNKVGSPNLAQSRIGQLSKPVRTTISVRNEHEIAISLVSLTLLTAVKPAAF